MSTNRQLSTNSTRHRAHLFGMEPSLTGLFGGTSYDQDGYTFGPAIDVHETDDNIVMECDLPGLKASDVDVSVDDGVLTISGSREDKRDETIRGYHHRERRYGQFTRSFRLPRNIDEDKMSAQMSNGTLALSMPKRDEAPRGRRIEIVSRDD